MRITTASVLVDDQEKALQFYTNTLGFQKKTDVPPANTGGSRSFRPTARRRSSPEPDVHPAARPFKEALVADGIPWTSFGVADAREDYERLKSAGVRFVQEPAEMGRRDRGLRRHLRQPDPGREHARARRCQPPGS